VTFISKTQHADVVLIGGGVMSATLGAFLKQLEPNWTISLFEKLDEPGLESSGPWNNAGTGHAALCELNYSPAAKDGSVDPSKAIQINEQFQLSRQFWSHLVTNSMIGSPKGFINTVPHMSFVIGEANAKFLRTRYEALKQNPLFRSMEYSEDHAQIAKWAPLIVQGRDPEQRIAATRAAEGTDVDFGALTRELITYLGNNGAEINYGHDVNGIKRASDGGWDLSLKHPVSGEHGSIHAKYVFVGAGGGALHLLQASGIPESKGYGGFPVSGQFFRCTDETLAAQHGAKVYGQASVGAPPMSVPHLDTRFVNGKRSLLFGPYAGFSTNFLKNGCPSGPPTSSRCWPWPRTTWTSPPTWSRKSPSATTPRSRRCASTTPRQKTATGNSSRPASVFRSSRKIRRRAACCSSAPRSSRDATAPSAPCSARPRARPPPCRS
jgi:malate dehydrogenase (quinone)